ncbi:MAG TPA: histidine kinase [Gemmatimonas sp.]|uniref:sensor histidine kinase n=1 Tax=Gemmatimonas sp. TaxID=1962908 RepID=UPI002ED9690A
MHDWGATTRQVRSLLLYLAAWCPFVLLYALLVAYTAGLPTSVAILASVRTVGLGALLGLAVREYAQRDPWPTPLSFAFAIRHVAGAALYAGVWAGLILVMMWLDLRSWNRVFVVSSSWIGWQGFNGVVLYAVVAGLTWMGVASRRSQEMEAQRHEADALRVRAELEALRGRLDPHFLFNTLHSLMALARLDPARTEMALGQLSDLLRYVLDSKRGAREQVQLADEVHLVRTYLALESLRYGDRLRVTIDIEEDALDFVVPSLTVQPIVENAIRHAIAPRADGGHIAVSARFEAESLVLTVADDGPPAAAPSSSTGVGLDALRRRLRLLYGVRARVDASHGASGFTVTVHVPA